METGSIPAEWHLATVTAIYKQGSKTDMSNYIPASLTGILCKVMESFIRDHFLSNNLFSDSPLLST